LTSGLGGVVELARGILGAAQQPLGGRIVLAGIGHGGHVVHRAAQCRGAEQRSLRSAQHFDAIEIERIDVGNADREAGFDDGNFVEIIADGGLALLVIGRGGDAADHDFRDAGLIVVEDYAGQAGDVVAQRVGVHGLELIAGHRADRHGHVAELERTLGGGDDDFGICATFRGLFR